MSRGCPTLWDTSFCMPCHDWRENAVIISVFISAGEPHELTSCRCCTSKSQLDENMTIENDCRAHVRESILRRLTRTSLICFSVYAPFCVGRNSQKGISLMKWIWSWFSTFFFLLRLTRISLICFVFLRHSVSVESLKSDLADELTLKLIFEKL